MRAIAPAALVLLVAACDTFSAPPPPMSQEAPDDHLPPAQVDLPEVPPLTLLETPAHLDDGSWSIAGVLLNRDELRNQDLSVSGIVQEIYVCPPDADAGTDEAADDEDAGPDRYRAGCLLPNLTIGDTLRSEHTLLVVGYDAEHYEAQLQPGMRYTFTGPYTQRARGFMSTEDGLLIAQQITGEGVIQPGEEVDAGP